MKALGFILVLALATIIMIASSQSYIVAQEQQRIVERLESQLRDLQIETATLELSTIDHQLHNQLVISNLEDQIEINFNLTTNNTSSLINHGMLLNAMHAKSNQLDQVIIKARRTTIFDRTDF